MIKKVENQDPLFQATQLWNNTLNVATDIIKNKKQKRYVEAVLLLSSLLEEQLRLLIGNKIMFSKFWLKYDTIDCNKINEYFLSDSFSFYQRIRIAVLLDLIDNKTYKNLEAFRKKRNRWIHNFYLDEHRSNPEEMLKLALEIFPPIITKMNYYTKKIWD